MYLYYGDEVNYNPAMMGGYLGTKTTFRNVIRLLKSSYDTEILLANDATDNETINQTLHLTFGNEVTDSLKAGVPYIIKWEESRNHLASLSFVNGY